MLWGDWRGTGHLVQLGDLRFEDLLHSARGGAAVAVVVRSLFATRDGARGYRGDSGFSGSDIHARTSDQRARLCGIAVADLGDAGRIGCDGFIDRDAQIY